MSQVSYVDNRPLLELLMTVSNVLGHLSVCIVQCKKCMCPTYEQRFCVFIYII